MREILFRAKGQTSDKWYEGLLTRLDKDVCHIKDNRHSEWICDSETVCQYTGLTDKNGRKIFDGDIVREFAGCDEFRENLYYYYQIRWDKKYCAFEGYDIHAKETFLLPDLGDVEIIGNIFDNPELCK